MSIALMAIIVVFVLGYIAIATEHSIHIDKTASAILTAVFCWSIYALFATDLVKPSDIPEWFKLENATMDTGELAVHWVTHHQILDFLGEISSILFFLLGAMTIVELVDAYGGFTIITDRISAKSTVKLLWIIAFISFFLSAALDNLTTTIVMISLIRKLIKEKIDRLFFAGIIVVAANAGGAWSPIGDVTTTMLWIGNQITTLNIIKELIIPSLVVIIIPLLYLTYSMKGQSISAPEITDTCEDEYQIPTRHRNIIFF